MKYFTNSTEMSEASGGMRLEQALSSKEMEEALVCQIGHEDRQQLEALIKLPRVVVPLKDFRMKITLGPGKVKRTSVIELAEEYTTEKEGGQLLLDGGSLTVPVADYVKKKYGLYAVETIERMEKELLHIYDELSEQGFSQTEMNKLVQKNKEIMGKVSQETAIKATELYTKYQKFGSEMAEVKVKEALESLNVPGLKIRSVIKDDVWKKCKQLYERSGLKISHPGKKDEYDLQMICADGDLPKLILIEVKSGNSYPWDSKSKDLPPNCSLFEGNLQDIKRGSSKKRTLGSWGQLCKSYTFISELFMDIAFGEVLAFTALPNTSHKVLEGQLGNSCCLTWVLCKEDLEQPELLRKRLRLNTIENASITGKKLLCTMASRLVGPGSGLYSNLREPAHVRPAEKEMLTKEIEAVDSNSWLLLDSVQAGLIEKSDNDEASIFVIEGAPGTGKTTVGLELVRRRAERPTEDMDERPLVFISVKMLSDEATPLGRHLAANAEEMNGQLIKWDVLLSQHGIQKTVIEGSGKSRFEHMAANIVALVGKLQKEPNSRRVIIMIDEIDHRDAPRDNKDAPYEWTALQNLPKNVTIVLIFNPGFYFDKIPVLFPASCTRLVLPTTYRSTQRISGLHTCLVTSKKDWCAPVGKPGTEVLGQKPGLVVIGMLEEKDKATKLGYGLNTMRSFMGMEEKNVTVIVDAGLNVRSICTNLVEEWGWTVTGWGEMFGAEADRVVVVGSGHPEAVSRAKLCLGILLCYEMSDTASICRRWYMLYSQGLRAAIEQGLVVVAIPPWHPQLI